MALKWDQFQFRYPFRKYQRIVLNQIAAIVDTPRDDRRYHIVAPPGSGKTIIGLELIRRFQRPALILAPTVAIQMQWYEKVRMFLPDDVPLEEWATTTPEQAAPLQIFTYQRLAVQDPDRSFSESAARTEWAEEVIARGLAADPEGAQRYLDTLKAQNSTAYWQEIRRRYPRLKRRLLREDPAQIARFLHPNALRLIEQLAAQGVGVVVLDECHHLLDYWAVVIRYLIGRLDQPRVVGLTATLPSPEDDWAYENYTALLGDVDFEVPTPAVVKEGNLAPYRELAYFTEPTPEELAFLRERDRMLHDLLDPVLTSPRFANWLCKTLLTTERQEEAADAETSESEREAPPPRWNEQVDEDPLFALAGLRWLLAHGHLSPSDPLPPEARRKPTLEDQLILLERYALQVLLSSPDPSDHRRFLELGRRLRPFGYTLTPRGLRQSRSPMDLVLAFSDSKIQAVREILRAEKRALGERLRAIVVTDFEQSTAGLQRLQRESGAPDADLGSGRRVFRQLIQDPEIDELHPVFITGQSLWIAEDFYPTFLAFWERFRQQSGWKISLSFRRHAGYYEVRGKGSDWGPRIYVPLITRAMEEGLTRLLIGTRGIFGEGWDALSLNVLIDLTGVTTSVAVQQLRGRSLRLDPEWPHKVAHNWDVICVAPDFEWGDRDLQRFYRRHEHLWGIVLPASAIDYLLLLDPYEAAALQDLKGRIIRGLFHIEPGLAMRLSSDPEAWRGIDYGKINRIMLRATARREETYQAWEIGQPYSNFEGYVARLRLRDLRFRTVYTLRESATALRRSLRGALVGILTLSGVVFLNLAASTPEGSGLGWWAYILAASLAIGSGITLFRNRKIIARALRTLLVEFPPDAILLDMGRALLAALQEAGVLRSELSEDHLRVIVHPDGACSVRLDGASPEEAAIFIQAYREMFAPIRNPRYLILRLDDRLPEWLAGGFWKRLRAWIPPALRRPVYYPVPQPLATQRPYAEAFARAWQRYVGDGQLIYTRSPEGRRHLYRARTQESFSIQDLLLTLWQ